MSSNTNLNIIKKINLNRLLNNSKLNYFLILVLALFIGCYHLLNINLRNGITNFVTMPLILVTVMIIILSIGYHNITLGLLMATTLFIILYPLDSILPSNTTNNIEGFTNKKSKLKKSNERYKDHENERQKTVNKFKNYLRDIFDDAMNEEKEEMEDMIKENLQTKLEHERSNNNKPENFEDIDNSNSSKSNKNKESMSDVINNSNMSNKSNKSNNKYQTIKVRKFDPTSDEDTNLLITKEILEDVINRITFQYESNDYLKRYISTRLQEIVRLNGLLNLDGDDDE